MEWFFKDKSFIRRMLSIALPVSVQFLISTSLNMADTVMISSLGGASIAAVGLVNQFVFFYIVICFGISSAGAVFFAQYFGIDNQKAIRKYLSISLQITFIISLVFTIVSFLFSRQIMSLLIPDMEVILIGENYLKIVALSFTFTGISQSFNAVLRSVNRAKEPLSVSIIAFFTNVILNYIFIFGKLGMPKLGVVGAGVGTLISRIIEMLLLIYLINNVETEELNLKPIGLFDLHKDLYNKYFKVAIPIILAETQWSLGQLLFAVAYARIGQNATAAVQLSGTVQNVFYIIVNSLSSASAIIIGHSLGSNAEEKARKESSFFLQITIIVGILSLFILVFAPNLLLKIFSDLEPEIHGQAKILLQIRGVFITFRYLNSMLFVGTFRAGGDTRIPLLFEMVTMWLFGVPMAFISVLHFAWPLTITFTIVSCEELIKATILIPRYLSGKWMHNITE